MPLVSKRPFPDTTYAYWAGVFDNSGSIRMGAVHGLVAPKLHLRSSNPQWLRNVCKVFGGKISPIRQPSKKATWSEYWQWNKTHSAAKWVLQQVYPYMQNEEKKKVIKEAIDWEPRRRGKKYPHPRGKVRVVRLLGEE